MGEEIETYILKKLEDAINESKDSSKFHLAARLLLPKLHKEFTELRELINIKRDQIKLATATAASRKESTTTPPPPKSNAQPAPHPTVPAVTDSKFPDSKIPGTPSNDKKESGAVGSENESGAPLDAGDKKESSDAAGDKKETSAPSDAAVSDKKDLIAPSGARDDKETSAPLNVADKKESGASSDDTKEAGAHSADAEKETGAPLDAADTSDKKESGTHSADAGDEKETGAGDKKQSGAPSSDAGDEKETDAPADAADTSDKKESGTHSADAGDEKETGAGDKKQSGAPSSDAGDEKETGAPLNAADIDDKKESDAPSADAGDEKEAGAPLDDTHAHKESGAPSDAADASDKKESGTHSADAGDEKEAGAHLGAGDKKELGAPSSDAGDEKETDAPADAVDKKASDAPSADAGDEKEAGAHLGATHAGDKKKSGSPLAGSGEKESGALLTTTSAKTDELEASSAKTSTRGESEISHATDAVTGDTYHETITPKTTSAGDGKKESDAPKSATFAKSSSPDETEITGGVATDRKSKKPPTSASGGGKKESNATNTDSNIAVNEEDLLREQLYYLNNVLIEWQMITKKPLSYSIDSYSSIKDLSETLKNIKLKLKPDPTKKTEESSPLTIPTTPEKVVEYRWSTRVNIKNVYGFEDKILSLERLLVLRRKDTDQFKAFGIHGMAGVGKTTLCQSIFNRPKVMGYFFPRIWVCLSKQEGEDNDTRKEVVKRMLRCLGIDDEIIMMVDEKQDLRGLLFALCLQLTGKRYFIVLDDAYNADEWFKMLDSSTDADNENEKIYHKFSYGLPKECGGTVLVTSRVEQVVKNMVGEEENLRCIEPLTDEESCWEIFKDTVKEDGIPFPDDLNKLKLEIVKRCDGLPLAAKLLGQIKHKEVRDNPNAAGNQRAAI